MRSDYALYAVAIILFAITCISYAILAGFETNLSMIATATFGLFFLALGYTQRPRTRTVTAQVTTPTPSPPIVETTMKERAESVSEALQKKVELTSVKGIKEKRAEQLKALGVNDVQELANASAKDLAAKLKISAKFTEKWIADAKKLVTKS